MQITWLNMKENGFTLNTRSFILVAERFKSHKFSWYLKALTTGNKKAPSGNSSDNFPHVWALDKSESTSPRRTKQKKTNKINIISFLTWPKDGVAIHSQIRVLQQTNMVMYFLTNNFYFFSNVINSFHGRHGDKNKYN